MRENVGNACNNTMIDVNVCEMQRDMNAIHNIRKKERNKQTKQKKLNDASSYRHFLFSYRIKTKQQIK